MSHEEDSAHQELPAPRPWSRALRWAIGLALIGLVLSWVDLREVAATLARADLVLMGVVVLVMMVDRAVMAYKWNGILRAMHVGLPESTAFRLYLASDFVGTFLPTGVGGDVFRALRARGPTRPLGLLTASIALERVIGALAVGICACAGLAALVYLHGPGFLDQYSVALAAVVAAIAVIAGSVHPVSVRLVRKVLGRAARSRLARAYFSAHQAYLEVGRQPRTVGILLALSMLEMAVLIGMNVLAAVTIGLSVSLAYFVVLVPLSKLALSLPITVGGIGVLEGGYVLLFTLAGLTAADAMALALVMRAAYMVLLIPAGLALLTWVPSPAQGG